MKSRWFVRSLLVVLMTALLCACTHELAVQNLDTYSAPTRLEGGDRKISVAILPFSGGPDETFYFNALVDRVHQSPTVEEVRTEYIIGKGGSFKPDVILSIQPQVSYRSSGWNFLINWPGFLILTPAWNGYVYHADILTRVAIHDGRGELLSEEVIPISYDIRQAEMDRTIWTGLTWLEWSVLALVGGVYNAFVFDDDILPQLQVHVRDNYSTYVGNAVRPKILAAAEGSEVESSTASDSNENPGSDDGRGGTCFAISPDGKVVTAHHVVAGGKALRVRFPGGEWRDATILDSSPANDVAVLGVAYETPEFLTLAPTGSLRTGQRVFTMGYPVVSILGTEPKFSEGSVSALSGPGGERALVQVTVPVQPGSSGGPLVDEVGRVVGVVTSTAAVGRFVAESGSLPQNVNWAINTDFVRPLFSGAPSLPSATREEAIQRTRRALCIVEASN